MFRLSQRTLSTSAGEDISIGFAWRPTMMANSARDPYWQAGVRRESIDHAGIEKAPSKMNALCATCRWRDISPNYEGKEGEFSRI